MPYRSGVFQTALGAICAVSFILSKSFGNPTPGGEKRMTGVVKEISGTSCTVNADAGVKTLVVPESASVLLNDRVIGLSGVENGRKVSVSYFKKKGTLYATEIDVFPTHADFEQNPSNPVQSADSAA